MFQPNSRRKATAAVGLAIAMLACGPLSLLGKQSSGIACTEVSADADHAFPGELISVRGLPDNLDGFYVEVDARGADTYHTLLIEQDDGTENVLAPAHPNGIGGGDLTLTIRSEDVICPDLALAIDPLPEAPGAFKAQVEDVGKQLTQWRDRAGVSRDKLLNDDISPDLVPLALAQYLYDSPDNPNALVKYAEGTVGISEKDQAFLDAITERSNLRRAIEESLLGHTAIASTAAFPPAASLLSPNPQSAASLADDMTQQASCAHTLSGATGELIEDSDFVVIGTGLVNPAAGEALWAASLAARLPLDYCAFMLPSHFTSMDVQVSIDNFNEDYDYQSKGGGKLTKVTVSGASEGWHLTGAMIDLALFAAGPAGKQIDKMHGAEEVGRNFMEEAISNLAVATNIACQHSDCKDVTDLTIDPVTFSGVDIRNPDYVVLTAVHSIVLVGGQWGSYNPAAVGRGGLQVDTQPGVFGDANIGNSAPITVNQIEVTVSPHDVKIDPGTSVDFTGTIQFSDDPAMNQWEVTGPDQSGVQAHNTFSFVFNAPPPWQLQDPCKAESKVYGVIFRSTSMTGLRAGATDERSDVATIEVEQKPQPGDPRCGTPTPTPTPDPDTCLYGTWSLNFDSYLEMMRTIAPIPDGQIDDISGYHTLTFNRDWTVIDDADFVVTASTSQGSVSVPVQNGGTLDYSANPDTGVMTVGSGGTSTATAFGITETTEGDGGSAQYTCNSTTMTIQINGYPQMIWDRQP